MNTTRNEPLLSLGRASTTVATTPDELVAIAERLSVNPTMTIDGVPFYTVSQLAKINGFLRRNAAKQPLEKKR